MTRPVARRANPFSPIPEAAWTIACDAPQPDPPRPNHDKHEIVDPPYHGAPLGGFGAGTFARTYRGDFARWHLHTGYHVYRSIPACAQLLSVRSGGEPLDAFAIGPTPSGGELARWRFRTKGFTYRALYPFSWYEGDAAGGRLGWRITQFSPVLPHNYRDSSLPVAVLRGTLHNTGREPLDVRLATSWENLSLTAPGEPVPGGTLHRVDRIEEGDALSLWMGRQNPRHSSGEEGAFVLATDAATPFVLPSFDPSSDGTSLWDVLADSPREVREASVPGEGRAAGAVGGALTLAPGETREITFSLAWHFPVFAFGGGRRWYRRYTRFYVRGVGGGDRDDAAHEIARDALRLADVWAASITAWQQPIVERRSPALARTLFNSLYILADGGTAWEAGEVEEEGREPAPATPGSHDVGRFAVLECFTYPYYATLDVRYYGSLPLLYLWPELERQVLLQFAATVSMHDAESRQMLHVKEKARRKRAGTLPHDLGSPDEDPWVKVNAYDDIDPNRWKDLGPKFVLLVARYLATVGWEDRGFLRAAWPAVSAAMSTLERQDKNRDGLPENEGIPDQTFDKWPMTGTSAYCALLAVAAIDAATDLARWSGNPGKAKSYRGWRRRALASLEKILWRDDHFAFDDSPEGGAVVMAGQLSGEWALAMAGLAPAVTSDKIRTTLETIWRTCATRRGDRLIGLRNGAAIHPHRDPDNRHAREVWPGINYPVAALMILNDMREEATELVEALASVTFEDRPFAFMTPEAWDETGRFRGALYMRALSVWGVEEALRRVSQEPGLESFLVSPGADAS